MINNAPAPPNAVLIAAHPNFHKAKENLNELKQLTETYGAKVITEFIQPLKKNDSRTYIGKGKCEEVAQFVQEQAIDLCIFDDDLSPSQTRNLEQALKCPIMDRSLLILEIFSNNARTAQAKVQVELAKLQYMLPRLTRMWTHLERQRGGIGSKSGAGEKELETDKRLIRNRIAHLKNELKTIEQIAETQRKHRNNQFRVALVGYTNAGKSSLMNLITKANVLSENKLFATLDTTIRKVHWNGASFLLSDTVGFIKKLPHHLIESFKSTLSEIKDADLLLHVVDISHPLWEEQIQIVNQTLESLGAFHKPTFLVLNKADLLSPEQIADIEILVNPLPYLQKFFISTTENIHVKELKDSIASYIQERLYL